MTPSRADGSLRGQELWPGPAVVGQPYGHRWRAPLVTSPEHATRLAKRRVRPQPVVLEECQPEQRIPRRGALGESVHLARQARQRRSLSTPLSRSL